MELDSVDTDENACERHAGDLALVQRIIEGNTRAFEQLMRNYNQRLYRVALSIVEVGDDAKDILQESYIRAYSRLASYQGRASLGAWLTRIVTNLALDRLRQRQRQDRLFVSLIDDNDGQALMEYVDGIYTWTPDPESSAAHAELRHLLESAVMDLPPPFRMVFMLREVEGLSMDEIANHLEIPAATAKTRAFRARQMLQQMLNARVDGALQELYPFLGTDCSDMIATVMQRIETGT